MSQQPFGFHVYLLFVYILFILMLHLKRSLGGIQTQLNGD